jgi:hypothetical protein
MFSPKKLAFLTQNKAKLCKILIITLFFEKNANFFAENWQKSPKIVIITPTPDWAIFAYWAIFHFGQFYEKSTSSPKPSATYFCGKKLCINFDKKWVGLHFG